METYKINFSICDKFGNNKNKCLYDNRSRVFALSLLNAFNSYLFDKLKKEPMITVNYLSNIDITCYTYGPLDKNYIYQIIFSRSII